MRIRMAPHWRVNEDFDPAVAHLRAVAAATLANQGETSSSQSNSTVPNNQPSVKRIRAPEASAVTRAGEVLDARAKNWAGWSQSMQLLFNLFEVNNYVLGRVTLPDHTSDPEGASNWQYNDTFAQNLITTNISPREKVYTNGCPTSHRMWLNLQSMHKSTSHLHQQNVTLLAVTCAFLTCQCLAISLVSQL